MTTELEIDFEHEVDGRWIAEAVNLPGVLAYGFAQDEARLKVEELARQAVSDPGPRE
jgi:predicted RNase H-like HicB family nuclease